MPRIAAFAAGLVYAASFWPWPHWWLTVAALALLAICVLRCTRGGFATGFAFGFGCFVAGLSWLYVSMHDYGGMPAALAALALALFACWLALFPALACAALQWCHRGLRTAGLPPALRTAALSGSFAGAWALSELLRGWLFTGFPWLAAGYAQIDGPLAFLAPWLGVFGISCLAALSGSSIALAILDGSMRRPGTVIAALPVVLGLALSQVDWTSPQGAPIAVRLVQGNVAQDLKFDPRRSLAAMKWYAGHVSAQPKRLTVLPETAWTVPWSYTPRDVRAALLAPVQHGGGRIAIGMPLETASSDGTADGSAADDPASDRRNAEDRTGADEPRRITNSVAIVDAGGSIVWRYDKRHLVPFGEFVPPGFRWFVDLMHIPLGDFARGARQQAPFVFEGQKLAFDICYEDLFGDEIASQVRQGATILLNVSNIAWFGDSHALPQHLQIARMRAIETARPMLRATNTGVTAAIDARGAVVARLPPYTAGVLDIEIQGQDRLTPVARFGNRPALILSLLLIAGAAAARRRALRRRRRPDGQTR